MKKRKLSEEEKKIVSFVILFYHNSKLILCPVTPSTVFIPCRRRRRVRRRKEEGRKDRRKRKWSRNKRRRTSWLLIITDRFNISLFSALEQTRCVHVGWDFEWVTVTYCRAFCFVFLFCLNTHQNGVLTLLFGCCMAGAAWKCSEQDLCTPYNFISTMILLSFNSNYRL